jgi:hypothetical protein
VREHRLATRLSLPRRSGKGITADGANAGPPAGSTVTRALQTCMD